jgi:hypothetical protein
MHRLFHLFALAAAGCGIVPAAAQTVPACAAGLPAARSLRPYQPLTVLADSAFGGLYVASRDFDTVSSRFRVQVQPSGEAVVLCGYPGAGGAQSLLSGAARRLRFMRGPGRPFHDIATVDVTVSVSRPTNGASVHEVRRLVSVGDGVRVELAQVAIERRVARFTPGEELAIYRAALLRLLPDSGGEVRCVVFRGGGGREAALARSLDRPGARVVPGGSCPPTRFTQMVRVNAAGAPLDTVPPGWVDPLRYELAPLDAWSADTAALTVRTERSTRSSGYTCMVVRAGGGWRAECRNEWNAIASRRPRGTPRAPA